MAVIDAALSDIAVAKPTLAGAAGKRCRRHEWVVVMVADNDMVKPDGWVRGPLTVFQCRRCGAIRDETRARRGKSSRRLGSDQERRAERRYGWEKIGERGQMTDLRGKLFKVQQKASRRATPALFRAVFGGLEQTRDGRIPLLLLSYVRQGVGVDDYIVIRGSDFLDLHGTDAPDIAQRDSLEGVE